jgi:hypothetical protein
MTAPIIDIFNKKTCMDYRRYLIKPFNAANILATLRAPALKLGQGR